MLANKDVMATIAVKDLNTARKFYQQTLGFAPIGEKGPGSTLKLKSGKSTVLIYQSQYAGTNKATSATWGVGKDMDAIVHTLQKAKVPFEHYNLPGIKREGDVHVMGDFKAAWFKDPDGNILHINNM